MSGTDHSSLEAFYAAEHEALMRAVSKRVTAPHVVIEDACSFAWCQLVARDDIELGRGAYWWLFVTASRQAWKLLADLGHGAIGSPDPALSVTDEVRFEERHLDVLDRRDVIRSLTHRQRCFLMLQAAGYHIDEISQMTGATARTVERQIKRARHTLLQI